MLIVETEESQTPVAPQVQGDSVAPLRLKRVVSSDINETVDTEDQQPALS